MRRRELIALTVFALFSARIRALAQQQPRKVSRIGYLGTGGPTHMVLDAFRQGLRDLGWVEGQNLVIEYRFAEGHLERLPDLAAELVGLDVQVIAASPTPAALAAKAASRVVPVVGISFDNPVEHGLIESLARPGGNVTGLAYSVGPEIFAKDLALLREETSSTIEEFSTRSSLAPSSQRRSTSNCKIGRCTTVRQSASTPALRQH